MLWSHEDKRKGAASDPVKRRRRPAFGADESANTMVIFALALPVLVGAASAAIDYSLAAATRIKMQAVADAAAMASVQEIQLAQSDQGKITAVANNYVNSMLQDVTITTNVDLQAATVQVILAKTYTPVMGGFLIQNGMQLSASATAKMSGAMPLCMLALNSSSSETISLQDSAVMNAPGCLVQTNSKNKFAMDSHDSAVLKAGMICSAGGALKFVSSNFSPAPTTDCPVLPDPLKSRVPPSVGACNYTNTVVDGVFQTLQPGVYCGGLKVTNNANVKLAPGIFSITGGPLIVDRGSTLTGTYVGIYLSGANANLTFDADTTISLSAPASGQLAGILIYDDPSGAAAPAITPPSGLACDSMAKKAQYSASPRQHQIYSNNAQTLTGTIYMPQGQILIDASKPIANYSAYTVLVVDQLHLCAGPTLVLNSDYGATDVPVPRGVGPYGAKTFLSN